jgi:hypothetical protein
MRACYQYNFGECRGRSTPGFNPVAIPLQKIPSLKSFSSEGTDRPHFRRRERFLTFPASQNQDPLRGRDLTMVALGCRVHRGWSSGRVFAAANRCACLTGCYLGFLRFWIFTPTDCHTIGVKFVEQDAPSEGVFARK